MLSAKTKKRLTLALTRKALADELEAALTSHAPLSERLKRAIIVALANKKAGTDLISALEMAGAQSLSLDTKRRIVQELADKTAGQEVVAQAQSAN